MSKNLDETVRLQFEKRQKWIRKIRGKRVQGIEEGKSSAPRMANSSAASFSGRNECPGIHYSLIVQEERKSNSCRISQRVSGKKKNGEDKVAKIERESKKRREEK